MQTEDIDDLLLILENGDLSRAIEMINKIGIELDTSEDLDDEIFFSKIVEYIEKDNSLKDYLQKRIEECKDSAIVDCLLPYSKDVGFIKKIIENWKEYDIDPVIFVRLVVATKEDDYIKSFIEDKDKQKEFGIEGRVCELVSGVSDIDYIKEFIKRNRQYLQTVPDYQLVELITATKDIISFLENEAYKFHQIKESDRVKLIIRTENSDYIENAIKSTTNNSIKTLLINSYKKQLIKQKDYDKLIHAIQNSKTIGFNEKQVIQLILALNDENYANYCIENAKKIGIGNTGIKGLILAFKDIETINEQIHKSKTYKKQNNKKIKLDSKMTFGIEIETEGKNSRAIRKAYRKLLPSKWRAIEDGSLDDGGLEIVSPILRSGENRETEIYEICNLLNYAENKVSDKCGGHIHIGADYLTCVQSYDNLLDLWCNNEDILYLISNQAGELPRESVSAYAGPISKKFQEALENGEIDLENEQTLGKFTETVKSILNGRYYGINPDNIGKKQKNTIEFRLFNGTTNPDVWIENINLAGGIIRISEEITQIKNKQPEEITPEDEYRLEMFNKAIDINNSQEQRLLLLLELVVGKEEMQTYIERYKANRLLQDKKDENGNNELSLKISKKPVRFSSKRVGKAMLTGDNPITGDEFVEVSSAIDRIKGLNKTK